MKNKPLSAEADDTRTIANMNVEGMPWYQPDRPARPDTRNQGGQTSVPGWKETLSYVLGAWKASAMLVAIYSVTFIIVILVLIAVWS